MTPDPASGASGGPRLVPASYAIISAVLALASTFITIIFTLVPGLKPDPRERVAADVSVFDVEPAVAHAAWIRRTSSTAAEEARRQREYIREAAIPGESVDAQTQQKLLRVKGNVVYVTLTIEGFKRRNVSLRWSMYGARSGQRVPQEDFQDARVGDVDLEAPTDRSVVQFWVSPVPVRYEVFVRVELVSDGTLLAVADTGKFARSG